ncbi:MAG: ankyrin repeat domain-containing protein [Candidatus Hydrogenedentes bacterium]|nr:ankyrin repeat domain-containing protein [Candidatus Hydrogenedentota bacterium]
MRGIFKPTALFVASLAAAGLLGAIPHLCASYVRVDAASYTSSEVDAARESIAISLLGQLQMSVGDLMWLKSMEYLHVGVVQRMPTRAEEQRGYMRRDSMDTAMGMGHTEGVNMTLDAERDWRGFIGAIERHVKPYQEQHMHDDPVEIIPWYQLAVRLNPRLERLYTLGAFYMADFAHEPGEAKELLEAGVQANPHSFEIHAALGRLFVEYAGNLGALEHEHEEGHEDKDGEALYDPKTPGEAYETAVGLLRKATEEALRQAAVMAKQRQSFDDFQKQVHGETYLFLAQALTELGRYDEAVAACEEGSQVTKYALLRSQQRIAEKRRAGEAVPDEEGKIADQMNHARRGEDGPKRKAARAIDSNKAAPDEKLEEMEMPPLSHVIRVAIGYGDSELKTVKQLLDMDPTLVSQSSQEGELPTHCCVRHEAVEILKYLVSQGADVNGQDRNGQTPLHLAAWFGKTRSAETLIELGADVRSNGADGLGPLHIAAREDRVPMIELLLEHGARVDEPTADGRQPLHVAAQYASLGALQTLLAKGADVNAADGSGSTAIHCLLQCYHPRVPEPSTLPGGFESVESTWRGTPDRGAQHDADAALTALLEHAPDVNQPDGAGFFPIHYAVWSGNSEIVDKLLKAGALPDSLSTHGVSALELVTNTEVLSRFQTSSTEPHSLNLAVVLGSTASVEAFRESIGSAANPLLPNPLIQAAALGRKDVLLQLITLGFDINGLDQDGLAPLHLALRKGEGATARILCDTGADPNLVDPNGESPLHLAVQFCDSETVSTLLDAGASPNSTDRQRRTPLHIAGSKGNLQMVKALVESGADPDAADEDGLTSRSSQYFKKSIREYLKGVQNHSRQTKAPDRDATP